MVKDKAKMWIFKPSCSSQGKGIYLSNSINDIKNKQNMTVSHYINNPLLIDGFKFDLRIYVLITSLNPLRIYRYREGLVRFATAKYTNRAGSKDNRYVHLTNYSINKHNSSTKVS